MKPQNYPLLILSFLISSLHILSCKIQLASLNGSVQSVTVEKKFEHEIVNQYHTEGVSKTREINGNDISY